MPCRKVSTMATFVGLGASKIIDRMRPAAAVSSAGEPKVQEAPIESDGGRFGFANEVEEIRPGSKQTRELNMSSIGRMNLRPNENNRPNGHTTDKLLQTGVLCSPSLNRILCISLLMCVSKCVCLSLVCIVL